MDWRGKNSIHEEYHAFIDPIDACINQIHVTFILRGAANAREIECVCPTPCWGNKIPAARKTYHQNSIDDIKWN